jgi:hypothetical protein
MRRYTQPAFKPTALLVRWMAILLAILVIALLVLIARGIMVNEALQRVVLDLYLNQSYSPEKVNATRLEIREQGIRAYQFMRIYLLASLPVVLGIITLQFIWLTRTCRNLDALGMIWDQPGLRSPSRVMNGVVLLIESPILMPIFTQSIWKMLKEESLASDDEEPTDWIRLIWSSWGLAWGFIAAFGLCVYLVFLTPMGDWLDISQIVLGVLGIGWAYTVFRIVRHISAVQTRMAAGLSSS